MITHLEKINKNSKKIKSRMSKQIKGLEKYIKDNINFLSESEAEYLFLGDTNLPGLLDYCGTMTKFSGNLKNSALTALKLLQELLQISVPKVFSTVFFNFDTANYLRMKLPLHFVQAEENKYTAFVIAKYIKVP